MANKYWKKSQLFFFDDDPEYWYPTSFFIFKLYVAMIYNILVVENDQKRDNLDTCNKFLVLVIVISINLKNICLTNKFRGPNTRSIYTILEVVYTHLAIIEFILKNEYEKPQHL